MGLDLTVAPGDPALALFTASLAAAAHRRSIECRVHTSAVPGSWSVALRTTTPLPVVEMTRDHRRVSSPLAIPIDPVPRMHPPVSARRRIAIAADPGDRRIRLIRSIIDDCTTRRMPDSFCIAGPAPRELARIPTLESFETLAPAEICNLMRGVRCVLDAGDDGDPVLPFSVVAAALGTPVLVHSSSALGSSGLGAVVAVTRRGPDAFADAIAANPRRRVPTLDDVDAAAAPLLAALTIDAD